MALAAPRTGVLVILDGFGVNPSRESNAIALASTPFYDSLLKQYPHSTLEASEQNVGLPPGFMGNSEVGHLNIGAGRVVDQDFSLISKAIRDGSFERNPVLTDLVTTLKQRGSEAALHLLGLVSDGGVHSHILHLFALLRFAKSAEIATTFIHVFTDGRDTPPTSGKMFVEQLSEFCTELQYGTIASISGRFYAMDRDKRWERTQAAYRAIASGIGQNFADPLSYVEQSYDEDVTDEFIQPAVRRGYRGVRDGDAMLFFNFRADRARQLSDALTGKEFDAFRRQHVPTLSSFVTMTAYHQDSRVPYAFDKPKLTNTLGEVVSRLGWRQLRVAETEKYAHVTYFFNGGEETAFEGEKRILVPSARDVKTYDLKPQMSAGQVTDKLIEALSTGEFKFAVVNYANPDMVGHTGNLNAAIAAVEVVDSCLKRIVGWAHENSAFCVITADHGNCEKMTNDDGSVLTSHTTLPVPFIVVDPLRRELALADGSLCDIAPTLLYLWGVPPPRQMTGRVLVTL